MNEEIGFGLKEVLPVELPAPEKSAKQLERELKKLKEVE